MSSPDVFRSSPMRTSRYFESEVVNSSSPDLPSIKDLASQVPRRPPLRSGSKAQPIPEGATSTFMSAKEQWKSVQAAAEAQESADPVVEAPPEPIPKPKKARKKPSRTKKTDATAEVSREPIANEPWKKYKASPTSKAGRGCTDGEASIDRLKKKERDVGTGSKTRKKTGFESDDLQCRQDSTSGPTTKIIGDEPLQLESAMARRIDWTPPAAKTGSMIDLASNAPDLDDNVADSGQSGVFKTLLKTYGCAEQAPQPVTISDEDSSFLKKRKLVELGSTKDSSRPASPTPEKSPTKKKAPKKKARTITDLATAAYRPVEPTEPEPAASIQNSLSVATEVTGQTSTEPEGKGKAKKKAPRKSKKKQPPPKPILLSPSTALQEVSKQDFVFGTSSQLAREQSPTLLRDLHYALKHSASIDEDTLPAPFNSDAVEPSEKQKLWEAGARNEDGQLFDSKMVDLIDDNSEVIPADDISDPFGYVKPDSENLPLASNAAADNSFETLSDILPSPSRNTATNERGASPTAELQRDCIGAPIQVADDSFETLSDVLPDLPQQPAEILDDDLPLSSSQVSVSTDVQNLKEDTKKVFDAAQNTTQVLNVSTDSVSNTGITRIQPPKYELYTDVQLSKEITSFGFKPVKKRTAMLSLLDQCWKSKTTLSAAAVRSVSTSAKPTNDSVQSEKPAVSLARPRGRPRKNSEGAKRSSNAQALSDGSPERPRRRTSKSRASPTKTSQQMNEPPPSAQPPESPKRGRGRPRKNSPDSSLSSPTKSATKKPRASKKAAAPRTRTPTKRPTVPKTVVEIPDSASENGLSDSSLSRSSSPEPTFSPPPEVDLSVSMEEDTELSLSMTPDDKEAALYSSLTAAITSAPRSTDPANPSWHEKILLYDPIVLEDITSWLNSGQLTRVGYDGEVSPGEVKKWCESKSVCCLWRVNLRGKERKRY